MKFCKPIFLSLISLTLLSLNAMDQKILNSKLIDAAFDGNLEETKALLAQGAAINAADSHGFTALMRAIPNRHTDIVRFLLQRTDPKVDINATDDSKYTALMWAAMRGNLEVVKLLLEQHDPTVNINAKDKNGRTAFMRIGGNNDTAQEIMQLFLERMDPNDPTIRLIDINAKDKNGMTPLIFKATYGGRHSGVVDLLLEQRNPMVDINAKDTGGKTALMWAAEMGNTEIIETLLNQRNPTDPTIRRVDVNATDRHGKTALMRAAYRGMDEAVGTLLSQGTPEINIYATDETGKTALGHALKLGGHENISVRDILVVKLLLNAMGENLDDPKLAPLVDREIHQSLEQLKLYQPQSIEALDTFHLFARRHPFDGIEMKINKLKTKQAAKFAHLRRAKDAIANPDAIKATETEDAAGNITTTDYMGDTSLFERALNYLRRLR